MYVIVECQWRLKIILVMSKHASNIIICIQLG
jgi:hypothetical protein